MTDKFTPGPWRISAECPLIVKRDFTAIGSDEGELICSASCHPNSGYFPSPEQGEANARLIAAAPDLLDALFELRALVRGECPSLLNEDSGGDSNLDMRIGVAIARATGEQS